MRTPVDDDKLRRGRRLLKEMLPRVRLAIRQGKFGASEAIARSGLGSALEPHMSEKNLKAVMVYEGPPGCWYADLVLKKVPPGIADSFGTPASRPLPSRAAALEEAYNLLAMVLSLEVRPKAEPRNPVFRLHGLEITVPATIVAQMSEAPASSVEEAHLRARLDDLVVRHLPQSFGKEDFDRLEAEPLFEILSLVALCLACGIVRHPDLEPGRRH